MVQDTSEIKEKIMGILKRKGPSLPVHIAREIESSILFASAFLSEVVSEKRVKISNMKVGNSPLYFIQGQEPLLERFSQYLKSRERDAFILLKERKFLKDSQQEPAIRIALRQIKDFAIPFRQDEEIIWRYFTVPETEFKIKEKPRIIEKRKIPKEKPLGIFGEEERPRRIKKKKVQKENKFFTRVKEFLSEKSIELIDIISFSKNEIMIKVRVNGEEKLLIAYNKKRIGENDIIKVSKKASDLGLSYIILSLGEPLKKTTNLIKALKNLSSLEKLK
jgi:hypothetical protein